jgi:hypothetical protein
MRRLLEVRIWYSRGMNPKTDPQFRWNPWVGDEHCWTRENERDRLQASMASLVRNFVQWSFSK